MTKPFTDRLADAVLEKASNVVVGLDPNLDRLPTEFGVTSRADLDAVASALIAFNAAVIDQVAPYACAVKPQVAFYEAWGPPGLVAYAETIRLAREAGLLVIGDIKRGDIGSTAQAYARAHVRSGAPFRADAVTLNPYLGTDSVQPFLDAVAEDGAGVFVLVRTSNPSAGELQDLTCDDRALHAHVADLVVGWGDTSIGECGYSSVGAVVGATAPRELLALRRHMPRSWLLLPGVGAQGATPDDVACAFDERGLGAVVNSSRGILYAYDDPARSDWRDAVRDAARTLRDDLRQAASCP